MTVAAIRCDDALDPWMARWDLVPDGDILVTASATLRPVRRDGTPLMLRVAAGDDGASAAVLDWWGGDGAARVVARDGAAALVERATGPRDLGAMARDGGDVAAALILARTAARLHAPRPGPPPPLVPLERWFAALPPAGRAQGGILARAAATADALLAAPRDRTVLHGDLHHANVLDFGARGWCAIDPKGLLGERGFELAVIFTNPDLADPSRPLAGDPARLPRLVAALAPATGLAPARLLRWILAQCGLSAAWFLADGDTRRAAISLAVAEQAAAEIDR